MIYLFNNRDELIKIISQEEIIDFTRKTEINSFDEAEFELDLKYDVEILNQARYFGFFIYNDIFKMFKITTKTLEKDRVIKGLDRAESDLNTVKIIKDRRLTNVTADQALTVALEDTGYEIGEVVDLPNVDKINYYYISPREALVKIIETFHCEFDVRYTFVNNKITSRYVDLFNKQGRKTGKQFYHGQDLLNIKSEEDDDKVITALIGRGKGEETDTGGFGRRIEFTDIVWEKSKGKPINKPAGQNYIVNEDAKAEFGLFQNGELRHRWGVFVDENIEDKEILLQKTYEELKRLSIPLTVYTASLVELGSDLKKGDTVAIIRDDLKIAFQARIHTLKIDMLNSERSTVELGDYETLKSKSNAANPTNQILAKVLDKQGQDIEAFNQRIEEEKKAKNAELDDRFRTVQLNIDNALEQAKAKAEVVKAEINSDIQSKLSPLRVDTENFKREFRNDLTITKNELTAQISQAKEILSRLQINTESHFSEFNLNAHQMRADLELTKSKLIEQSTQSQNKLNEVKTNTENAKRELSQSLNRVVDDVNRFKELTSEQFNQTSILINQTKNSLETNISRVESTIPRLIGVKNLLINSQGPFKPSENRIDNYKVFTDSYINLVQGQDYILSASTDGVFSKTHDVSGESDHVIIWLVNGNVNQIISDNSTGSTGTKFIWNHPSGKYFLRINTYRILGTKSVWNIKISSGSIKTDWTPALEDSDNKILEIKTKLVQTAEGLTQLSQKTVDSENRLTRNEVDIRRLNDEVSSKVTKTDFDKVNNRLTTTEILLRQTADGLISKVNRTDFDRISSRVSTAETGLTQVANEIKLKASKSDVDSLTGRVAKAESSIQVANDRITSEVGRVETNLSSIRTTLTQTANVLETKASKTDFDTLKQKVSNAETSIRQATDSIQLKANQSDLNTLDHRLNDATTQIRLTASAIEQKVNRSELNDLTGRVANAESSIRQTVDRINLEVSKIPTEIGGRNLLKGTAEFKGWNKHDDKATLGYGYLNNKFIETAFSAYSGYYLVSNGYLNIEQNTNYTISFWVFVKSKPLNCVVGFNKVAINNLDNIPLNRWTRVTKTFNSGSSSEDYTTNNVFYLIASDGEVLFSSPKLERGSMATDWTPAPEDTENDIQAVRTRIEQTADSIRQSVSELSANTIKQSDVSITSSGIVMRAGITDPKKSVGDLAAASFRLNPYQIDLFAEKIRVKGDMLVDGAITAQKIASGSIDTAQLRAGAVNTTILSSDAVTADKLRVDEALFNKLSAGEVLAQKLFAKSAFITSVQSVDLSANRITSGMLRARNGAVNFNLDSGQLNFYTDAPAIKRIAQGYPNQFVKFETGLVDGKKAGVTVIGSNRDGNENSNDGSFVGIRAWNSRDVDAVDLVGDTINLTSSPYLNADGWKVNTLPFQLLIGARREQDRISSTLEIGNIKLFRTEREYIDMRQLLWQFNVNFKHLANITGRGDVLKTWDAI